MSKDTPKSPTLTPQAQAKKAKKAEALKDALRANLRKRKAQARGKASGDTDK